MIVSKQTVWLIMSKDRKLVARGTPRNRYLISVDDIKDKKRYLTYTSKGRAEAGFSNNGFYGQGKLDGWNFGDNLSDFLEAVECDMLIQTK
jgi:hypothetical protein